MSTSYLQRLVEVMDQLRSPGGCPWDAEQTHESLIKYLLEESYEFIDTVAESDRAGMREELGDILLQVYFHSRIAQDHPTDPFSIEDVLLSVIAWAHKNGIDPEDALRMQSKQIMREITQQESR